MEEDPRYLTEQIVTYLGNKRSLLHFLGTGLEEVKSRLGKEKLRAGDLFSGSGIVARFLKKHSEESGAGEALPAPAAVYGRA